MSRPQKSKRFRKLKNTKNGAKLLSYVTKEMSARAREISLLDYIKHYESHLFKSVGSSYRSREHPSLAVSEHGFFWHSKGKEYSGVTALDYLMKIRDYDFVSAVWFFKW